MEHTAIITKNQYGQHNLDCTCGYSCFISFDTEAAASATHAKHVKSLAS